MQTSEGLSDIDIVEAMNDVAYSSVQDAPNRTSMIDYGTLVYSQNPAIGEYTLTTANSASGASVEMTQRGKELNARIVIPNPTQVNIDSPDTPLYDHQVIPITDNSTRIVQPMDVKIVRAIQHSEDETKLDNIEINIEGLQDGKTLGQQYKAVQGLESALRSLDTTTSNHMNTLDQSRVLMGPKGRSNLLTNGSLAVVAKVRQKLAEKLGYSNNELMAKYLKANSEAVKIVEGAEQSPAVELKFSYPAGGGATP